MRRTKYINQSETESHISEGSEKRANQIRANKGKNKYRVAIRGGRATAPQPSPLPAHPNAHSPSPEKREEEREREERSTPTHTSIYVDMINASDPGAGVSGAGGGVIGGSEAEEDRQDPDSIPNKTSPCSETPGNIPENNSPDSKSSGNRVRRTRHPVVVPHDNKKEFPGIKYSTWMAAKAQELVGKLGARHVDLAEYFEVSPKTIESWVRNRIDFRDAVKKGRIEAALRVSQALYQRAVGYELTETIVMQNIVKEYHPNGKPKRTYNDPITVEVKKSLAPDVNAANKYLQVMFREVWTDTSHMSVDHNHSGQINVNKIEELDMSKLTPEIREFLFKLNTTQLSEPQQN